MRKKTEIELLREEVSGLRNDIFKLKAILAPQKTEKEQYAEIAVFLESVFNKIEHDFRSEEYRTKGEILRDQRVRFNKAILVAITKYLTAHPDTRFGQALAALKFLEYKGGLKDPFYEEPYDMYMRFVVNGPDLQ